MLGEAAVIPAKGDSTHLPPHHAGRTRKIWAKRSKWGSALKNASSVICGHTSPKYKYSQRCMKQQKSEIEWDVILSSQDFAVWDSRKLIQTEETLALYAKPSMMHLSKMVIYFSTAPFLGVWDYSFCLFPVENKKCKKPTIFLQNCSKSEEQVPLRWDGLLRLGGQCLPLFFILKFK